MRWDSFMRATLAISLLGEVSLAQEANGAASFPSTQSPDSAAPGEPSPTVPVRLPPGSSKPGAGSSAVGTVSFVATPGVAFHRVDGGGNTTRICLAPCVASFGGDQRFALSLDGKKPVEASELLPVSPGSRVEGEYRDNSGWRQAGWIVLAVGVTSGIGVIASGAALRTGLYRAQQDTGSGIIGAGVGLTALSLIVGLVMVFDGDEAHVHLGNLAP